MNVYFTRLWAALKGKPLPADTVTVELRVETVHSVQVVQKGVGPVVVIAGGGGPTDPGKPK